MSRFYQKSYKALLESPRPGAYRNNQDFYKEKTLWKLEGFRKYLAHNMFKVHFAIVLSCMILGLLILIWSELFNTNNFYLLMIACILGLGPMLFIAALIGGAIWIKAGSRNIVRNREDVELEKFVSCSALLQKYNIYHIKAIRQTLGHVYSANPRKIHLSDTPKSLRSLGYLDEPYGFELIFGVSRRLGIVFSEVEVDHIVDRIHNNAGNIEELASILCDETATAEGTQSNVNFEAQLTNTTEKLLEKKGKNKFRLGWPGAIALMCFFGAISAELEESDNFFSLPTVISVLKAVVVGYFIGLAICMAVKRLLRYLDSKKPKDSNPCDDTIDLEELRELADNSPLRRYVNCLILEVYYKKDYGKILKKYEPLPLIDDFDANETLWFAEVANRLKTMAKIEQIPFVKPRNETIALVIEGKPVNFDVEFCDGLKDGYVKLNLR